MATVAETLNLQNLRSQIACWVEAHPEDFPEIQSAVAEGVRRAMARMNESRARADAAMLLALGLSESKRVSNDFRQTAYKKIAEAIHPRNACELEKSALAKSRGEQVSA